MYAGVPYDGSDPEYEDFYLPNHGEELGGPIMWYTRNPWWHQRWFERVKDVIDQHQPDLLYSDGDVPFGEVGLNIVAHLYNSSASRHGANEAVYNQKNRDPLARSISVLDIERNVENQAVPYVWQTDTCVGGWFYNVRQIYKTPGQVIELLVDIVSKNGNLLLNLPQRPDGTLDDECTHIARRMAAWIAVNGEGIYGTRPWTTAGEGPTALASGGEAEASWTGDDFRFTAKGDLLYAFQMKWPDDGRALIRSLAPYTGSQVESVELLGFDGAITFAQTDRGLDIALPQEKPCDHAHCFRIRIR